jgi:hypothetical protein
MADNNVQENNADAKHKNFLDAKRAYEDAVAITQTNTSNIVVLNFKALQLLRIRTLQQKLFDLQMGLQIGGFTPDEYDSKISVLDSTLQNYGQSERRPGSSRTIYSSRAYPVLERYSSSPDEL